MKYVSVRTCLWLYDYFIINKTNCKCVIVKSSIDNSTNELQYEIINDHLEGSFDSRLSVRVGCGSKYRFSKLGYFIEIEGSYHKFTRGYNSHNGYYDLQFLAKSLINIIELSYNINYLM